MPPKCSFKAEIGHDDINKCIIIFIRLGKNILVCKKRKREMFSWCFVTSTSVGGTCHVSFYFHLIALWMFFIQIAVLYYPEELQYTCRLNYAVQQLFYWMWYGDLFYGVLRFDWADCKWNRFLQRHRCGYVSLFFSSSSSSFWYIEGEGGYWDVINWKPGRLERRWRQNSPPLAVWCNQRPKKRQLIHHHRLFRAVD